MFKLLQGPQTITYKSSIFLLLSPHHLFAEIWSRCKSAEIMSGERKFRMNSKIIRQRSVMATGEKVTLNILYFNKLKNCEVEITAHT